MLGGTSAGAGGGSGAPPHGDATDATLMLPLHTRTLPLPKQLPAHAGDLFAALLLGWLQRRPGELKVALEAAVAGLQAVLRDTVEQCSEAATTTDRTATVCAARELRLVQNQAAILRPEHLYAAEAIDV